MATRGVGMLFLLATFSGSEVFADGRAAGQCHAVRIEAIQETSADPGRRRRYRDRFSAEDVLDLRFVVLLPTNNQPSLVEVKLFTPSGRLYDVLTAEPHENAAGRNRRHRARGVAARFPVAGSHITSRSLYGKWEAQVHLDGREEPCKRKRFIIDR